MWRVCVWFASICGQWRCLHKWTSHTIPCDGCRCQLVLSLALDPGVIRGKVEHGVVEVEVALCTLPEEWHALLLQETVANTHVDSHCPHRRVAITICTGRCGRKVGSLEVGNSFLNVRQRSVWARRGEMERMRKHRPQQQQSIKKGSQHNTSLGSSTRAAFPV